MLATSALGNGERIRKALHSIPVRVTLEGPTDLHTNVISLLLGRNRKLCSQCGKVQPGNLLAQLLGQQVDIIFLPLVCQRVLVSNPI